MSADTTVLYILILVISGIGLLAIALGVAYWLLFTKYKALKENVFAKQKEDAEFLQQSLSATEKQSLDILNTAQNAAKEIVSKAQNINKANSTDLASLVDTNLRSQKESYDHALQNVTANIHTQFQNLPAEMKQQLTMEIQKLIAAFESQMSEMQEGIKNSLHEPYEKAIADADKYRNLRMQEFETHLFELLQSISKEVLRKELTTEEHEKLVLKSLEEAKANGIF